MENILKHTSYISGLIVKEITKAISPEEQVSLNEWRKESDENEALYQKLHDSNFHIGQFQKINDVNTELALKQMQLRIKAKEKKRKQRLYIASVAAAAIALILVIGKMSFENDDLRNVKTKDNIHGIVKTNKSIILMRSDGTYVSLDTINSLDEKGAVLTKTGNHILKYNTKAIDKKTDNKELVYNEIIVPRGKVFDLILSDGTVVKLNADSRLKYPVDFKNQDRKVSLEGEGYFSVTKNAKHPFVVKTGNQQVKVLGTEFNINGYKNEDKVYTTLVEGRVNVFLGNQKEELLPGEQTVVDRNRVSVVKRKVNVEQYISWKDGYFILENQSLEEVMKKFERWYDIDIVYSDDSIKNVIFKGQIPRYLSLKEALLIIEKTANLYFKVEGKQVTIYLTH